MFFVSPISFCKCYRTNNKKGYVGPTTTTTTTITKCMTGAPTYLKTLETEYR